MKNSSLWLVLQKLRAPFLVIIVTYTISIVGLLIIDGVDAQGNPYHLSIFDAFYFISYTATTIGFGETPFAFTYPQRIWVSISIFITVTGWFYSLGSLVALLQDKLFLEEFSRAKFRRSIAFLKERYIIILGYNSITSEIIKKANESGLRAVVIEKEEEKRNHLLLENFTPPVYCLNADAYNPEALEMAGIKSPYCRAIVSLFENDALNLRIALTSKVLNPNITMAIKSTTKNQTENLMDIGVQIIENPFEIIADHIHMAINAPHTLKIVRWIYGLCNLYDTPLHLPQGKYIVCGYGRMGKNIYEVLKANHFEIAFAEIDPSKKEHPHLMEQPKVLIGDGDDKEMLKALDIDTCVAIIAGTNDDTTNLSILATAKKLNPNIMTIARENELEDFSIFESSNIDTIFIPAKVLINKTINAILNPALDLFIKNVHNLDESAIIQLTKKLLDIDLHPQLFTLKLDENQASILYQESLNNPLTLSLLRTSLKNRHFTNNLIPLMRIRQKKVELLPDWETPLERNDIYLFAGDANAKDHLEYIANNVYEFYYAYYGEEKSSFKRWFSKN
ncbi:potassium channel family protein [Sulfurospirillum deleyianum]|uniref:TrkA-N domain protein n=1 Tax=Sulfurospirillum deleyianum (strain ATCC 51133 / DSM 6946 / 5175) TaxID=525898 RepID=D1AYX6_SULD5|nr:NAD(P)-binding protein [Sulfurospirillum deleyianum]ACZ11114.1 TrkA-N domain protein [Sulfurospirillum deleyianum DSM 6946]